MLDFFRCWCGESATEVDVYGAGLCNFDCSGNTDQTCGGDSAFSLYEILGGGGGTTVDHSDDNGAATDGDDEDETVIVAADDDEDDGQGNDDGGLNGDEGNIT